MDDLDRIKKLSGLSEGVYADEAMTAIKKLIYKISRIPDDFDYMASNLDQTQDYRHIAELVAESLEKAAAKIRS